MKMLNYKPLVSVLIPVYNAEKYIERSLNSIINQTYKNLEIIIINDGSTDRTLDIIRTFTEKRITVVNNEKNLKLIKTLNLGLNLCNGKYIARMDSDDISDPERISKQVEYLEYNEKCVACGSQVRYFSEDGKTKRFQFIAPENSNDILSRMYISSPMCHPSVMFRRDVILNNNLEFNKNYPDAEDYHFWYLLSKYGELHNLQEQLLNYRLSKTQITQTYNKIQRDSSEKIRDLIFKDDCGFDANSENISSKEMKKLLQIASIKPGILVYFLKMRRKVDYLYLRIFMRSMFRNGLLNFAVVLKHTMRII
ncbi:glycosyltransferase family 2 protein [Escherichia coli]